MSTQKVVSRLSDFEIEEVSLVDRPANKRTFLVRKNHEGDTMKITKAHLAQATAAFSAPLEKLVSIVATQKSAAGAAPSAEVVAEIDRVIEQFSAIADSNRGLLEKFDGIGVWPSAEAPKLDDSLEVLAHALAKTSSVVNTLKDAKLSQFSEQDFATQIREGVTVGETLTLLKGALKKNTEAAAAPAPAPEVTPAPATEPAPTTEPAPATPPAAEAAPPAAETAPAAEPPATETPPAPAAEAAPAAEPAPATEATPPATETPPVPAAVETPPAPAAEATNKSIYADDFAAIETHLVALSKGEATRDDVTKASSCMDRVYMHGGISLDTYDMEALATIINALLGVMDESVEKAVGTSKVAKAVAGIAERGLVLVRRMKAAGEPTVRDLRELRLTQTTLSTLAPRLAAAKSTETQQPDLAATIAQAVQSAVAAAVAPLKTEMTKMANENVALRKELSKRDSAPAPRASSPEPATAPVAPPARIFPEDYNHEVIS